MRKTTGMMYVLALLSSLTACVPSTNIKEPLTALPPKPTATAMGNGAIFQPGMNERPMFEDRRARNVGDVLTINIVETTAASGKSGHNDSNTGALAINAAAASVVGVTGGASGSSSVKSGNSSDSSGSNTFSGSITVTVTEVLGNGNLRVAGEKQVAISHRNMRSGVVNPSTISGTNTVLSTQVADAHIEYKGANNIDTSAVTSMLNRFFFSVLPF
jgi:flagellar L-ring protein precursor FlgH